MKIGSNRNINKAEVYRQKSTASWLGEHAAPEIHLMKRHHKSVKDAETI